LLAVRKIIQVTDANSNVLFLSRQHFCFRTKRRQHQSSLGLKEPRSGTSSPVTGKDSGRNNDQPASEKSRSIIVMCVKPTYVPATHRELEIRYKILIQVGEWGTMCSRDAKFQCRHASCLKTSLFVVNVRCLRDYFWLCAFSGSREKNEYEDGGEQQCNPRENGKKHSRM